MADPFTIASTVFSIGQGIAGILEGNRQKSQAKARARVQGRRLQRSAFETVEAGEQRIGDLFREAEGVGASQQSALAGAGIALDSDIASQTQASTFATASNAASRIRANVERQARGILEQRADLLGENRSSKTKRAFAGRVDERLAEATAQQRTRITQPRRTR